MKKSTKVQVPVGSLQDMANRFTHAWNLASKGIEVNETNVTFLDIQTMLDTLSPRRSDLLKYLRKNGANNIKALALALGRDYKNVHNDVAILLSAGLLLQDGRKLSAPWDELSTHVSLKMA